MSAQATHVVMLVANDVATDTRVKKEALALAHAGRRVTIVGVASATASASSWLGPVEIVRIPVASQKPEAVSPAAVQPARIPVWLSPSTEAAVRRRVAERRRVIAVRSKQAAAERVAGMRGTVSFKAGVARRQLERGLLAAAVAAAHRQGIIARRAESRLAARHVPPARPAAQETAAITWREEHPQILDLEVAFAPVIDALAPSAIHAHDMHVIGIAAAASARANEAGRQVPWVYDAHEYVQGLSQYGSRTERVIAGWADLEAEFIRDADRVVTVSPAIADRLHTDYELATRPTVVLNIPTIDPPSAQPVPSLREVCSVAPDVPLLCYSGAMQRARGVHTAIDAMVHLPEAHLALVCVPHNDTWYVRKLRAQVADAGLDARVHFTNPVGPGQVVDYLRGIDIGLIPGLSFPSHEMSLPNKLFEYLHAGLPVVSSELESLGAFLRETGVGVTFPAEDEVALAAAVRTVLADIDRYTAAARDPRLAARYSWSGQADELRRLYDELLGTSAADAHTTEEIVDLTETPGPVR